MNHQDWNTVNIGNPNLKKKHIVQKEKIVKTNLNNNSFQKVNATKLENTDEMKVEYVKKEDAKKIQQARVLLKLSQDDLAKKLCVKKNIINDLESGKILKSNNVIRKALNILKIK